MVFSTLSSDEKEAFFSLLDEYFASRPEVLGSAGADAGGGSSSSNAAAASAVHRALTSNPQATSQLVSAGLKHASTLPKSSGFGAAASEPAVTNSVGRVAAAAAAFGANRAGNDAASTPPAPPRRTPSAEQELPQHERRVSSTTSLQSVRKFGSDVDTSSTKNMFMSLRGANANKSKGPVPVAPPNPPAFAPRKNNFAPPPVRRVGATPEPEPEQEQEEETEGQWAEALYDYSSEDPGDLELQASQRILVLERTSDDWWTVELNGKRGLVPASYVKVL